MKLKVVLGIILVTVCLTGVPALAQCCHHGYHGGDCDGCDHHGYNNYPSQSSRPDNSTSAVNSMVSQAAEGTIAEVIYLPGATPVSGIVQLRVQSAGQATLVELAPTGFLKQAGLHLREGDKVKVKGYPVAGMDGDLLVATEISKGDKSVSLRDSRGRPAW